MHFGGHIYEPVDMPAGVAKEFEKIQSQYDYSVQATFKYEGKTYWVKDGQCWVGTDRRIYPGVKWE